MQYREWKKTGEKISALGFGAMRLPMTEGKKPQVDEERAIALIRQGLDLGINYLDTAWAYHDGLSEEICAKVMRDGYREKVNIATKLPTWDVKSSKDMYFYLEEQRKKLEVQQIDYYLIHCITQKNWKICQDNDYKSFLREAKKQNWIRYYGFSFHDNLDLFKEVVDDFDWDFVQIQLNLLDENFQAGLEGMKYAASKGMDVVIMEPLRGGTLASENPGGELEQILNEAPVQRKMAEWSLRYLWNLPEVSTVLSGMSAENQLIKNVNSTRGADPRSLSEDEQETLNKIKGYYLSRIRVDCTLCRYCMPCPEGVNIPENFWAYNHDGLFNDRDKAKFWINNFLNEEQRPSACTECEECIDKCPQGIAIPTELKKVGELLEEPAATSK
jgi:uncharacterized protein